MALRSPRPASSPSPLAAARGAIERTWRAVSDFSARVYYKAGQDDIFFLAGGITFNFLLAAIPFLLLVISIVGYVLQATVPNPEQSVVEYMENLLPTSPRVIEFTEGLVR